MHIEVLHVMLCENALIEYMEDLYKSIESDNLIELVELIAD